MYIKAKYLKNDIPAGKAYTFETDVPVKIGDKISVGKTQAVVEVVNVPEEEISGYKDKIKKVQKVEGEEWQRKKKWLRNRSLQLD